MMCLRHDVVCDEVMSDDDSVDCACSRFSR